MSKFKVNLNETIYYLSNSLNLVGGNQVEHGKRVAFMAVECAKALDWSEQYKEDLFLAAILHDCGVSKTDTYKRIINLQGSNAGNHCSKGAELLSASPPLAYLSDCILHHHVDWSELKAIDLPDQVKLAANCINMLDTIDFLALHFQRDEENILLNKDKIRKKIVREKGKALNPELVDVFMLISEPESFWLALDMGGYSGCIKSWVEKKERRDVDFADLKSVVLIYSRMVDAKNFYTKNHSEGVANLSRYLGGLFELSEHTCDKLELAGLLHDLGKLRLPDYILDKLGDLTEEEFLLVKRHSFDTYDILKDIHGFEEIAQWAAYHHERIDGSGYPFRYSNNQLSLESRIVAVADVFQSCSQNRAHRERLLPVDVLNVLKQEMSAGTLDKDCVLMVARNFDSCWNL